MKQFGYGAPRGALLYVVGAALCSAGEKPQALEAAEKQRSAALLRTARIEFAESSSIIGASGQVTGLPRRYYTWRCADDAYVTDFQGDEEGVFMRDADGRPRDDLTYHGPLHFLVKDGETWEHIDQAPVAEIGADERAAHYRLYDLRKIGLDPVVPGRDFDQELRKSGLPPPQYETVVDADGLYVVSFSFGDDTARWWIDPQRGWNVVRTAVVAAGRETSGMRMELAEYDGAWFPRQFEYRRRAADGDEFVTVTNVLNAEFNRPWHPQRLTPSDIGVEAGMTLHFSQRATDSTLLWDGSKAVAPEEFFERLARGDVIPGPTVAPTLGGRGAPTSGPAGGSAADDGATATRPGRGARSRGLDDFESEWEKYTRHFIIHYRLDDEQARRAWTVCRTCQERGRAIFADRRADLQDWQGKVEAAEGLPPPERERQLSDLERRREVLMAPIKRIFEERLRPELEKLPTEKQRECAEKTHTPGRSGTGD